MTTDPFSAFESLSQYYPGSRRKRGTAGKTPQQLVLSSAWDEKPYMKSLNGEEVPMYVIGALARAINKSVHSIRLYEENGYLPKTPYRLTSRVVNGALRPGRRLYTRQMIEAVIASFADRGLLEARRIEWREHTDLPREIAGKWDQLLLAHTPTTTATS